MENELIFSDGYNIEYIYGTSTALDRYVNLGSNSTDRHELEEKLSHISYCASRPENIQHKRASMK